MKKLLLIIVLLTASTRLIQAQNPVVNPGFENWTSGNPDSWLTYNIPGTVITITQEQPGHSGSYAAKGQPATFQTTVMPPLLTSSDQSGMGFPVSQLYGNLSFWYKFSPAAADEFDVVVIIYDSQSSPLGAGTATITNGAGSFTQANVPITATGAGTPATCVINFLLTDQAGSGTPSTSSYYIVDDVALSGSSGIQNINPDSKSLSLFPLPASKDLTISYYATTPDDLKFGIFDIQGKKVAEQELKNIRVGMNKKTIDVSNLANGAYILKSYGKTAESIPLVVSH